MGSAVATLRLTRPVYTSSPALHGGPHGQCRLKGCNSGVSMPSLMVRSFATSLWMKSIRVHRPARAHSKRPDRAPMRLIAAPSINVGFLSEKAELIEVFACAHSNE